MVAHGTGRWEPQPRPASALAAGAPDGTLGGEQPRQPPEEDGMDGLERELEQAAALVREARYVVALVGAGISKESGIPTFRGEGGLWTRYGEPDMRGFQRFLEDPAGWWQARLRGPDGPGSELAEALAAARPNAGHLALAELERMGFLRHVITQNIDNLHQEAGSRAVTEIHGNRTKLRCIECHHRWPADQFPIREIPPRCPHCHGLVKSDTVMFGEVIPHDAIRSCYEQVEQCDLMLLVGTSAVVYPAADFPVLTVQRGGRLIEVNPEETPLSPLAAVVLRGPAGTLLPALVQRLGGQVPSA